MEQIKRFIAIFILAFVPLRAGRLSHFESSNNIVHLVWCAAPRALVDEQVPILQSHSNTAVDSLVIEPVLLGFRVQPQAVGCQNSQNENDPLQHLFDNFIKTSNLWVYTVKNGTY